MNLWDYLDLFSMTFQFSVFGDFPILRVNSVIYQRLNLYFDFASLVCGVGVVGLRSPLDRAS